MAIVKKIVAVKFVEKRRMHSREKSERQLNLGTSIGRTTGIGMEISVLESAGISIWSFVIWRSAKVFQVIGGWNTRQRGMAQSPSRKDIKHVAARKMQNQLKPKEVAKRATKTFPRIKPPPCAAKVRPKCFPSLSGDVTVSATNACATGEICRNVNDNPTRSIPQHKAVHLVIDK